MMDALRLYGRYVGISVRAQLTYRATFAMKAIGHLLVTGIEFLAIWALFARFGTLGGWTLREVGLLYAIVDIAFAINEATNRGFDKFDSILKKGDFDRMLLRPRSTILQLLGFELQLMRVGRLSQGIAVLVWASGSIAWSPGGGAFWTIESLEVWNAFTYGGNYAAGYPMDIYRRWFRRFFTAVVPLACTAYLPARAILGRDPIDAWHLAAPCAGIGFLVIALGVWRLGVRHHASTGT